MVQPHGHTQYRGYSWRLCPYSTQYKESYYDNDINGPSNHPYIQHAIINVDDHPTTEGTMSYKNDGVPGWICWDTNCPYYVLGNPVAIMDGLTELFPEIPPGMFFFES